MMKPDALEQEIEDLIARCPKRELRLDEYPTQEEIDRDNWMYTHMEEIGMFDDDEVYITKRKRSSKNGEIKPEEYDIDPETLKGLMMIINGQEIPPDMLARIKETRVKRAALRQKEYEQMDKEERRRKKKR